MNLPHSPTFRTLAAILTTMAPDLARADCPAMTALIKEVGIYHGGTWRELPRTSDPSIGKWNPDDVVTQIVAPSQAVSDGFGHVVYVNRKLSQAWIVRTGGIRGVSEWFGPLAVEAARFSECQSLAKSPDYRPPRGRSKDGAATEQAR